VCVRANNKKRARGKWVALACLLLSASALGFWLLAKEPGSVASWTKTHFPPLSLSHLDAAKKRGSRCLSSSARYPCVSFTSRLLLASEPTLPALHLFTTFFFKFSPTKMFSFYGLIFSPYILFHFSSKIIKYRNYNSILVSIFNNL
jgi:hypothetical protein